MQIPKQYNRTRSPFYQMANSTGVVGFKEFESDTRTLSGIEVVRMVKKNQLISQDKTVFKSFMSLAA